MPPRISETDGQVFIVGLNTIQNGFLADSLAEETGLSCFTVQSCADAQNRCGELPGGKHVILYDCMGKDIETCLQDLDVVGDKGNTLVCLFNVCKNTGIEETAVMEYGIRGFFYRDDLFPLLTRGVQAVREGEIWLSRHVLSNMVQERLFSGNKFRKILSEKEETILTLLARGATNQEIADTFCISKYTLKNWMQKIFKKLKVRGKLQAAIWATKNLPS